MIIIIGLRQYTLLPLSPKIKTTRRNHSQGIGRAENSMREPTQSGAPKPKSRPERARRGHPNQGAQHSLQLQSLLDQTPIHLLKTSLCLHILKNDCALILFLWKLVKYFFRVNSNQNAAACPGSG